MLLAEIRGKLSGSFACSECGSGNSVRPETVTATEDALTSSVFGAIRWLHPDLGARPLLALLGQPTTPGATPATLLWPGDSVRVLPVGDNRVLERWCEPDVTIDVTDQSLTVVEVKLGAALGGDPLQLPKEAIFAHRHAGGRPWRLVCVTPGTNPPSIRGFRCASGRVELGGPMPIADAVASYFRAATCCVPSEDWPLPDDALANTRWLSWSALAQLLETAHGKAAPAPHETNLVDDVMALLRQRGFVRPVLHGFADLSATTLDWPGCALWRSARGALWGFLPKASPWVAASWLTRQPAAGPLFGKLPSFSRTGLRSWPAGQWLAMRGEH